MHLNYHFLKFLCPELDTLLANKDLVVCFSQNKDELVMGFTDDISEVYIRANLNPSNTCLSFPDEYKRSKKNSADIFQEIIGDSVKSIQALSNERAFTLTFHSGRLLLFKLHGNRSNVLLYPSIEALPNTIFRNELKEDKNQLIASLERELETSYERFALLDGNAASFMPTLGKIPRSWLKSKGYITASIAEKWQLMEEMLDMLSAPLFSIILENNQYELTLLPAQNALFSTHNPIEACNEYFRYAVIYQAFEKEKNIISKALEEQKKKTEAYIKKTSAKLKELQHSAPPSQTADIIMANLHQIPQGAQEVVLFDFYQNKEITVQLKKGTSPQKHAENLYRKSKNRKIEIQQLEKNLEEKESHFLELSELLKELLTIDGFKDLREFTKSNQLFSKPKDKQETLPFKRFEIDGFEILVGKSAKANDQLLRQYAWKEDLWLHAKDVSGSHVLIKHKAGHSISKTTVERAAELAAYYSKSKSESLAAVMYTPCKYVRKVKGSAPGAVMVDKENVIMVKPIGPN
ncbi:DUF814 domain-containing protein [Echinicola sp. CAU 1574]|uniref:DUF814 domain-containing protein n=1 Tax=Echinicola arenosa TaxID=2774144 RepID=A0ABR9AFX4_9BACT|nr:NFACT RNA binding domain-containing protein [Echinicola arenosa]MBD8487621.1 DUF814 domain-containing protein [Echinicola arenosa]